MIGVPCIIECESVFECIKLAKDYKADFLELNLNFPYVREFMDKGIKLDPSIKYTLHFIDEADFIYDEVSNGYIKMLKRYLRNYKGQIQNINIHLNPGPIQTVSGVKNYLNDLYFKSYMLTFKRNILKLLKLVKKYKANLILENVKSLPHVLKAYECLLNENIYYCYDVGHDFTTGKIIESFFILHTDKYLEMHLHDTSQSLDHLALGSGVLDIKKYYNVMKNKYVLIEVKSKKDLEISMEYVNRIKKE